MSTFVLKMLAVLFMLLDHIYLYFFSSLPSPGPAILLTCVGRLSYPLFLFSMVWGYHYTRNRKAYLLRLYIGSLFMTAFVYAIDNYLLPTEYGIGNHNIFLSMFLVGVLISTIETFQKDPKKGGLILAGIFAVQILYQYAEKILYFLFPFAPGFSGDTITGVVPNLYLNEYGFEFVALGVLMYFLKEKKELFSAMYVLFCIAQFSGGAFTGGYQWLMILALPFMLRYNHEKGPGMKYFFYIFYPAHVLILLYIANFVL